MRRLTALRDRPDACAVLLIAALVVAANLIYVLGISDPNPLGPRGLLATSTSGGFTGGRSVIDPNIGYTAQALGHRAMLDLVHGHLPWWNPYEGTGAPLAGEMQAGAFFPPNLLLLMGNGQLWEHMLLELVAGASTYYLLRHLKLSFWACLAGAAVFTLNGTFAWLQHATFNPVAFLPMLLLGIERAREATEAGRPGGWRLIALAGVLSFVAGFPEVTYIDAILAVVWFGWRLAGSDQRRTFAAKAGLGALVAVLLSAPLLIAMGDYLSHGNIGPHGGAYLGTTHFPAQAIPQLLMPYLYGPIYAYGDAHGVLPDVWGLLGGYLTVALVMWAGLGLFGRRQRGLRIVLGIWALLVFSRAYGQVPLLGHVLGWLPAMGHINFLRYSPPALELAVAILAAFGVDDVIRAPRRGLVFGGAAASLLLVAGMWAGSRSFRVALGAAYAASGSAHRSIAWSAATVVVSAPAVLARGRRTRGLMLAAVLAVDALAMFVVPELAAPRSVTVNVSSVDYLRDHLGTGRFFTLGPIEANYGSYFGLASVNIDDSPVPSSFFHYITRRLNAYQPARYFDFDPAFPTTEAVAIQQLEMKIDGYRDAGVTYVLIPPGLSLPQSPSTFTLVARTADASIYRLAGAKPLLGAPSGGCRTTVTSDSSATVDCATRSRVVYRETAMPGWSASVDGKSTPIRRSGIFQSVEAPAGRHTVRFDFEPPHLPWGIVAFVTGLGALAQPVLPRLKSLRAA
jgi:hypothetical protein